MVWHRATERNHMQRRKDKNKVKTQREMLGAVRIVSVFKRNVYLSLGNLE